MATSPRGSLQEACRAVCEVLPVNENLPVRARGGNRLPDHPDFTDQALASEGRAAAVCAHDKITDDESEGAEGRRRRVNNVGVEDEV
jgi:hypothetical protein